MIFETDRLLVRKLNFRDLDSFHKMESNPKVLRYAEGNAKSLKENTVELGALIKKYDIEDNNFWIYGIERKIDSNFIGTLALIKDNLENEIGYRFIEEFWGNGYGLEICKATIEYCKSKEVKHLLAYVVEKNIASIKILKKCNFKLISSFINDENDLGQKYLLKL